MRRVASGSSGASSIWRNRCGAGRVGQAIDRVGSRFCAIGIVKRIVHRASAGVNELCNIARLVEVVRGCFDLAVRGALVFMDATGIGCIHQIGPRFGTTSVSHAGFLVNVLTSGQTQAVAFVIVDRDGWIAVGVGRGFFAILDVEAIGDGDVPCIFLSRNIRVCVVGVGDGSDFGIV